MAFIYPGSELDAMAKLEDAIRKRVKNTLEPALHERVDQLYDALRHYCWLNKNLGWSVWFLILVTGWAGLLVWVVALKHEDVLARLIPSLPHDGAVVTCIVIGLIAIALLAAILTALAKKTPLWQRAMSRALADLRGLALHNENRSIRVAIEARDPETADKIAKALRIE